jgi:tetratricopeptide (TPR) repeat protein
MKRVFIILFLSVPVFFQIGCASSAADANQNMNLQATPAVANTETNQANTKTESTPLPTFTDAETAFAEGNKLFDANEVDKAIEAYEQAVKLNPDLAEAYFKLGVSYAIREKEDELNVMATIGEAEEEEEPTPTPSKRTSKKDKPVRTKKSEKAFENAVKAYKKLIAKNPKDDVAHYNLGRTLNKLNEDADAVKALREAVKLQPENAEYQTELGEVLNKLAQYDEAVRALKKAVELDPTNLLAEELLEKAEAGKKRIDFAKQQQKKEEENLKPVENANQRPSGTPKPKPSPPPANVSKETNVSQ